MPKKILFLCLFFLIPFLLHAQDADDIIVPPGYIVEKLAETNKADDVQGLTFDENGNIIAGSLAFKKAAQETNPVLLEPIMNISVRIPEDCVGDIMGDLNSRRGKVMGMDSEAKNEVINAQVPMAEIQKYAADLTSITGGRGSFTVEFSHYEEVPAQLAEKIVEAANAES